jgi:signal transduction histidine kinase
VTHQHLPAPEIVARLRDTELFGGLDDDQLQRLAALGEVVDLAPGEALIVEGDLADALYVVLDGEMEVTKRSGTSEIPVAIVGPGALQGEIAALEGGRRLASVRAVSDAEVLRIPIGAMRELLAAGPEMALGIIGTAVSRLRAMESLLREREKLAGLGTLAAGLAHELNNPAAAALRSVRSLERAIADAEQLPHPTPPPRPPEGAAPPKSALERADRIASLEGIAGNAEAANALAEAGWTVDSLAASVPAEAVPWVAADASVNQLLGELSMALERISEIVAAVKGYTYLDQAPVQRVDVRIGLEQTLVILRHRLRDIEVRMNLAEDLPEIEAYGSELNQVWTNIIDNAVDAMDGRGSIDIVATADAGDAVSVEICNAGPAIPDEVRGRLFEPFFTTKEPGRGTGLGLHISHNVVVRHGGLIHVESAEGRTCFRITLPVVIPR